MTIDRNEYDESSEFCRELLETSLIPTRSPELRSKSPYSRFDPLSYQNVLRNVIRNEDGTISPRMSPPYSGDAGDETDDK